MQPKQAWRKLESQPDLLDLLLPVFNILYQLLAIAVSDARV